LIRRKLFGCPETAMSTALLRKSVRSTSLQLGMKTWMATAKNPKLALNHLNTPLSPTHELRFPLFLNNPPVRNRFNLRLG
jgi:hypothetical protein